jgi:hypothetical protein
VEPIAPVDDDAFDRTGRAQHAVAAAVGDVDVVPSRPGNHDRGSLPVDDPVVAGAALEPIAAGAAVDPVVAVAAADVVVAGAAVDHVVAVAAVDDVVAVAAEDAGPAGAAGAELVVAGTTHDPLTGSQPNDEVHPTGAHPPGAPPRPWPTAC